jgi:aspartyl-tRNA(Asn)/glutamyl-tRNA(Gln) amidotransferase subunit B
MLDLTYETPKPKVISGAKQDWELVIGMEVHAQVSSRPSSSPAPRRLRRRAQFQRRLRRRGHARHAARHQRVLRGAGGAHGAGPEGEIHLNSAFDRKNYFYPDLPQGYQISQLYHPIVGEGEVLVEMGDGTARTVRIERIHLEQDAGKSIHDMDPAMSFVDLNRTGVALMEIVSRPDIRGPRGGRGLCREAAAHHALPRHLRRQHAERQPARRRERVDLPARRL